MAAAVFDYAAWGARYPELVDKVPEPLAQALFVEAGLFLSNGDGSIVQDVPKRLVILNMIVAHLAALQGRASDAPIVGRINSATEGSVTVQAQYEASKSAQWWLQTTYGASAWQALRPYRTFRYVPGTPRVMQPYGWR